MEATLRAGDERGRSRLCWLDSRHAFSFAGYRDPAWSGFRSLRVLNDDVVAPAGGFGPHPHRNAEILSFVLDGALLHEDSAGGRSLVRAGEFQRLSAGRGVVHAEWNASERESVRFIQVWLLPNRPNAAPSWQHAEPRWRERGGLALVGADTPALEIRATGDAELLLFDLA